MKQRILIALVALMQFSFLFSEETNTENVQTEKLSLERVIEQALNTNSTIKESEIELTQSKRNYAHSWNNFLPSVTASATASEAGDFESSAPGAATGTITTNATASLSLNASLAKKIQALKESYKSGERSYENTIREIRKEVTKSFYSLLYMQAEVETNRQSAEDYKSQYEQTKIKKERGLVPELDLLTSQVNYESAKITLRNSEKTYISTLIDFLNEIGIEAVPGKKYELDGSLDYVSELKVKSFEPEEIDSIVEKSNEVVTIKENLKQAKLSKAQAELSSYSPTLTLSSSATPYTNAATQSNTWSASVGISLSLDNYIPGSNAQDTIAELTDSIKILELELSEKKKEVKANILELLNEIEIAEETLENSRLNAELAQKSYEMAEVAYKNGTKDLNTLQSIRTSFTNAELQYRSEQLNLINNILELNSLLGE